MLTDSPSPQPNTGSHEFVSRLTPGFIPPKQSLGRAKLTLSGKFALLLLILSLWTIPTRDASAAAPTLTERAPESPGQLTVTTSLTPSTTTATTNATGPTAAICATDTPDETQFASWTGDFLRLAGDLSGLLLPEPALEERVNILLMGSDTRSGDKYGHTDSMMLVTIDPISKTAALLSIPRDLWVVIPGYGQNRINMAYRLGQLKEHPGGGPALVMETIEANLGLSVHHYAVINFEGFAQIIDAMGGIDLCAPESIDAATYYGYPVQYVDKDNYYSFVPASAVDLAPTEPNKADPAVELDPNRGYQFLYIEAGLHHLDGQTALTYARSRASATADFARVQRQQAVLMAMRRQALQIGMLPKVPELWQALAGLYDTDLQLGDVLQLAQLAYVIPRDNIRAAAISHDQTLGYRAKSGASVLLPRRAEIKNLVESLFGPSTPTAPLTQLEIEAGLTEIGQPAAPPTPQSITSTYPNSLASRLP